VKKLFLLYILLGSSLFAGAEVASLTESFNSVANKDILNEMHNLKQNDRYFIKAIDYLTKDDLMANTKISTGDPESKKPTKDRLIKLPNYPNALKEFKQSVDNYNNPLSAYIALQIIKTKIPAIKMEDIKYKRKYIELLYKTTHSCSAYMDYADILLNGIAGSVDIVKAKEVLDNTDNCLSNASDWEKSIIQMKKDKIQFKLEHDLK
jgi:hypothetical protein